MPTTVHILIDGVSDERDLRAAFSTREAAEAALHLADDDGEVVELVLDGPLPPAPKGQSLWLVEEHKGTMAFRMSACDMDEDIGQVIAEEDTRIVYLRARDEAHALALGEALFQQAKG